MEAKMFCYQCQETAGGQGCLMAGVCGKKPELARAQDLLIYLLKGIGLIADSTKCEWKDCCAERKQVQLFVADGLFATITNANFDIESIYERVDEAILLRDRLLAKCEVRGIHLPRHDVLIWRGKRDDYETKAMEVGVRSEADIDVRSLKELTMYGLKGMAAYLEHASRLDQYDPSILDFMLHALGQLLTCRDVDELTALVLATGEWGVKAMALLDKANTSAYGHPEITEVDVGVGTRPGILISGHDLGDMEQLLEQSADSGVDIYTHCEMLPAHYYPRLKRYKHLRGNYGNSWSWQRDEFESFNGPILFTSNCIVPPTGKEHYVNRVFTTNSAGYPGWRHIRPNRQGDKDFSELIELAKQCQPPKAIEQGRIVGGFAHEQVFTLMNKVVEAVKNGAIRRFVVMAGCDGRMSNRAYYTRFAEQLPKDCVILTAGCAKFRYNKLNLGEIGGIPRVLDAGQCNDSYSLVLIAIKMKELLGIKDINALPIAYNIAWYEQKAVIVLLALLSLGIKHIHLGPTWPAFLSPNVAQVLVTRFGIQEIRSVEEDMKLFGLS